MMSLRLRLPLGPQGIVHGTVITLLNAGRKYLGSSDLSGKVGVPNMGVRDVVVYFLSLSLELLNS
jgi:Urocanase Rossmann-like domain